MNSRDFYNFQRIPFRSRFTFPDYMTVNTDDEMEELETLTTSLIDSMCSDFIFKESLCDCKNFHQKLKENEER